MKYEFKEGQWFDIRKLTDWQKQWCLKNLEWVGSSFEQIKDGHYDLVRYGYFYHTNSIGFGTTNRPLLNRNKEITFNDFYWGEEDKEEKKLYQFAQEIAWKDYLPIKFFNNNSVFDKPRWVTAKHKASALTQDKDYKVLGFNGRGDLQKIVVKDDRGKESSYHHNIFHKVTPQDLLPEECVDDEASFDNLVYVEPKIINNEDYYTLTKSQMSPEQWSFVISNIPLKEGCNGSDGYLNMDPYDGVWFDNDEVSESQDIYISFNDIFKEVN